MNTIEIMGDGNITKGRPTPNWAKFTNDDLQFALTRHFELLQKWARLTKEHLPLVAGRLDEPPQRIQSK